jgi:dolichol-phosphate mannosyltransferase
MAATRRILTLVNTFPPALAVIPTYNEAATLHRLIETFERDAPWIDVLIVDDASPDGTGALADRMAATRPWLHVLHRPAKDGLGNAYRAGFEWALEHGYPAIAQLDADLSHPPAILPEMLAALEGGADLVLGSRYTAGGSTEGWPLHRRLASGVGCALSARTLGLPYTDLSGGLKFWLASALDTIDVASTRSQGYVFQVETTQRAHRAGLRIVEVPFTFRERTAGHSKMRASIALEGVRMVARLRRDGWKPQRVASAVRTGA